MQSRWNDADAALWQGDLGLRVYTSRLLGADPALVLHGGGNTSVKIRETNLLGVEEEILYVKGSGWDLATIEAAGFAPVRMAHLLGLAKLESLSDPQMVNELQTQMTRAGAPAPSVESILHASLPYKFVDHTHADAVVTVTNTANGEARIREIFGDRVVVIPYAMPGFDLARACAERFAAEAGPHTVGMVLLNHGMFSFGATARESYERQIELVDACEQYLVRQKAWPVRWPQAEAEPAGTQRVAIAQLRADISAVAGRPMILNNDRSTEALAYARRADIAAISQRGPATPDHIIRTKQLAQIGRDVSAFAAAYRAFFERQAPNAKEPKTILDQAPRVVLDPELGLLTAGKNAEESAIVNDLYHHTFEVVLGAEALGGFVALPEKDLFEVEYWDLEQAKLRRGGSAPEFQGEVALVTGAASGIGRACAEALLKRGAAVVGLDIDPRVKDVSAKAGYLGLILDLTDEPAMELALEQAAAAYGGVDMLVLNAGIFPASRRIEDLGTEEWRKVMSINLDANLALMRLCHPLLKRAPNGGRIVIIGSKNVPAPGPGAGAYSASKAALNQLARVAALEWGKDRIRINSLHPNAVFDTGLWTEEVLQTRAASYGLSVEAYKTNNLLRTEVSSRDVAELAAAMCGRTFAKTTGAQVPVDGGNERVI